MPTIILMGILLIGAIIYGLYWLAAKSKGDEPKSQVLDESIDAKRARGERVDV